MSTSIRVSTETRERLELLKRNDESFDDLLSRLIGEEEPIAVGSWSQEEAERARAALDRSRESFER